jgi:biopolymer transport protein ExbD
MKLAYLVAIALLMVACSPSAPRMQQEFLIAADDTFITAGKVVSAEQALKQLGSTETTLVIITACPDASFEVVGRVVASVKALGYEHVGFAPPTPDEKVICSSHSSARTGEKSAQLKKLRTDP